MGVLGCWRRASPHLETGTHTLRGSIPGADDGREEPRPGGGGAGSKPFTALWGDQGREGEEKEKERLSFKTNGHTAGNSFALSNYSSSWPTVQS